MFYNIFTKETRKELPDSIVFPDGGGAKNPSIKEAARIGWREVPEVKAEAGTTILSVAYVQDTKDPLKVTPVVTSKTDAAIADEKAQAEQASIDAQAQYAADRKAKRDKLVALAEKNPAEAIGKLFDMLRNLP